MSEVFKENNSSLLPNSEKRKIREISKNPSWFDKIKEIFRGMLNKDKVKDCKLNPVSDNDGNYTTIDCDDK